MTSRHEARGSGPDGHGPIIGTVLSGLAVAATGM
jgi:hypothetical protein